MSSSVVSDGLSNDVIPCTDLNPGPEALASALGADDVSSDFC